MRRKSIGIVVAMMAVAVFAFAVLPATAQEDSATTPSVKATGDQAAPGQPAAPAAGPDDERVGRRERRDRADRGARPDRGARGPEEWRARMLEHGMERNKEALGATEEEWKAIEPLLKKVEELRMKQMAAGMGGFMRGRRGPGGPGGPGGPAVQSGVPEVDALRAALDDEKTSADDLKAKLDSYRAARDKDTEELKTAREELRKVLSVRQEANLVAMGVLD